MTSAARPLIIIGLVIVALGLYLGAGGRPPPLGRLPGDIVYRRGGGVIYIPITTMILLSVALTLVMRLFGGTRGR